MVSGLFCSADYGDRLRWMLAEYPLDVGVSGDVAVLLYEDFENDVLCGILD